MDEIFHKYTNDFSKTLIIEGQSIHYRDEGEGFPLVLLHGSFSSLHTWDAWTNQLKKHYRIIRCDLPGFGLTGPSKNGVYSVASYVNFLKMFLDELVIDKCHIVGNSLGGWAAWEFAYKYPRRVTKMILIDSAGYNDKDSVPAIFKVAQNPLLKNFIPRVAPPKNMVEVFVKNAYGDNNRLTEETTERYYDMLHREGNLDAFVSIANSKYEDTSHRIKEIETPTLVMWGEKDKWIPLGNAYKFNYNLENGQLKIYEGVGHVPMEEIPDETAQDALNFLQDDKLLAKIRVHTADLCDEYGEKVKVVDPVFQAYGYRKTFFGEVVTLSVTDSNVMVRKTLQGKGHGKVLVVDGQGSLRHALLGDKLAELARQNGWQGIIINGCIRDAAIVNTIEVGIRALNTCPRKSMAIGEGEVGGNLSFAGVEFRNGQFVYVDEDGILVSDHKLM